MENNSGNGNDSEIERLVAAIRRYLVLHPDASDNLAGIQRWWLGNESRNLPQKSMEAALSRLVQCGAVERIERHGQEAIYRTQSTSTKPN